MYDIKINKHLYLGTTGNGFISLKNQNTNDNTKNTLSFINGFNQNTGDTLNYNIKTIYNTTITDYKKLNVIQYKIEKLGNE